MSVVDRLINRPQRTATHRIYLDPNQADAIRAAEQEAQVAEILAREGDQAAAQRLAEARDLFETARTGADVATFHLVAVGARVIDQLQVDCEPTKAQKDRAQKLGQPAPRYDPDEFAAQLLAQAVTSVLITGTDEGVVDGLTVDQARDLWASKTWPRDDLVELVDKAMDLNATATSAGRLGNG